MIQQNMASITGTTAGMLFDRFTVVLQGSGEVYIARNDCSKLL